MSYILQKIAMSTVTDEVATTSSKEQIQRLMPGLTILIEIALLFYLIT
jgi:hypothetical protein